MTTSTDKDPEREKLQAIVNDIRPKFGYDVRQMPGRHFVNSTVIEDVAKHILANYVPASQATPKPAVLGDGELRAKLRSILESSGVNCEEYQSRDLISQGTYAIEGIMSLFASQATAAQDRMLEALAYPVKCLKEIDRVCTEELANFSFLHQGKDKEEDNVDS